VAGNGAPASKGKASLQRLWAPWRAEYIHGSKPTGCVFCLKGSQSDDKANYVLFRGRLCFCLLNLYPYNPGHIMVVPYRHLSRVQDLAPEESSEMFALVQRSVDVLEKAMSPHGQNIGMNLGKVAGAGIADHVHIHIVPRWTGDTNFMPVSAVTKVVSEALETTYDRLEPHFRQLAGR